MIQEEILGKSYYDAMILCDEYNQIHTRKIYLIIEKMNENQKFVKHIDSPYFLYLHLQCEDEETVRTLQEILQLPYENDRRHATAAFIQSLLHHTEHTKRWIITHISP